MLSATGKSRHKEIIALFYLPALPNAGIFFLINSHYWLTQIEFGVSFFHVAPNYWEMIIMI